MKRQAFLTAICFLSFAYSPLYGATIDHSEQYEACMELVRRAPHKAFDSALSWKGLGGGEAAEHCIAASLIAMKRYKAGAERLEQLAQDSRRSKAFKAELLAQAAQGWFLEGESARAHAVLSAAINLDDTNAYLFVDRAQISAQGNQFSDAIDDLTRAISLDEKLVEAFVFRGSVYRQVEDFARARSDIDQALSLSPEDPEALLESGMLHRIAGNNDKAREDWMIAIEVDPQSQTAQTARLNLEKMDLKNDE